MQRLIGFVTIVLQNTFSFFQKSSDRNFYLNFSYANPGASCLPRSFKICLMFDFFFPLTITSSYFYHFSFRNTFILYSTSPIVKHCIAIACELFSSKAGSFHWYLVHLRTTAVSYTHLLVYMYHTHNEHKIIHCYWQASFLNRNFKIFYISQS